MKLTDISVGYYAVLSELSDAFTWQIISRYLYACVQVLRLSNTLVDSEVVIET